MCVHSFYNVTKIRHFQKVVTASPFAVRNTPNRRRERKDCHLLSQACHFLRDQKNGQNAVMTRMPQNTLCRQLPSTPCGPLLVDMEPWGHNVTVAQLPRL